MFDRHLNRKFVKITEKKNISKQKTREKDIEREREKKCV